MTLVRFNSFGKPVYNNLFDSFLNDKTCYPENRKNLPSVNIEETDNFFEIDVAAPGLKKEDFKVNVENDVLQIKVEKKEENEESKRNYSRKEFNFFSFERSFTLPEYVEEGSIEGKYEDGILKIVIPKKEEDIKAVKEINIS